MLRKNFKGACTKLTLPKCSGVCRTFSPIQERYALLLNSNRLIDNFQTNVLLDGLDYSSDFVCFKPSGEIMVRECVKREFLTKPKTITLLDTSREYWLKRGVDDWGIVTNEE